MSFKRIVAITGIVILVLLYITTLISAIFTTPATPELFKACVYATVIVPVLFYAYLLIYKVMKQRSEEAKQEMDKAFSSDNDSHSDVNRENIHKNANILRQDKTDNT